MDKLDLTFVILAYNEELGIAETIEDCVTWIERSGRQVQILVMDDASTDGTGEIADRCAAEYDYVRVHHQVRNRGQFHNMRRSFEMIETTHFAFIPGDNQFDLMSFDLFVPHIGQYDIIFGFPNDESVRGRQRVMLSYLWRLYLLALFGVSVTYMGGLVVLPVGLIRRIPTRSQGFLGWYETTVRLVNSGASIIQLPFIMRRRVGGESKALNPLRNAIDVLRMARIWWRIKAPGLLPAGVEWPERRRPYDAFNEARQEQSPSSKLLDGRHRRGSTSVDR